MPLGQISLETAESVVASVENRHEDAAKPLTNATRPAADSKVTEAVDQQFAKAFEEEFLLEALGALKPLGGASAALGRIEALEPVRTLRVRRGASTADGPTKALGRFATLAVLMGASAALGPIVSLGALGALGAFEALEALGFLRPLGLPLCPLVHTYVGDKEEHSVTENSLDTHTVGLY